MRLLNIKTWMLELHPDRTLPPYAILSHTWGETGEITFEDVKSPTWVQDVQDKASFRKLQGCCEQAISNGLSYIWIDTFCIDKSSSAELSEAINSMFRYYKTAEICYAYLSDVSHEWETDEAAEEFAASRWFTRGWTLQELVAPGNVIFFDVSWRSFGSKATLEDTISDITRIPVSVLQGRDLRDCSVACKMSWAARRNTSREEDEAYCLMGLFDVNMPMLYGEQGKAFQRLQQEILKTSNDESLFAWRSASALGTERVLWGATYRTHGMLASSPSDFANSANVCRLEGPGRRTGLPIELASKIFPLEVNRPFSMTNCGLHIAMPIQSWWECNVFVGSLQCYDTNNGGDCIRIFLLRDGNSTTFSRVHTNQFHSREMAEGISGSMQTLWEGERDNGMIFVRDNWTQTPLQQPSLENRLSFHFRPMQYNSAKRLEVRVNIGHLRRHLSGDLSGELEKRLPIPQHSDFTSHSRDPKEHHMVRVDTTAPELNKGLPVIALSYERISGIRFPPFIVAIGLENETSASCYAMHDVLGSGRNDFSHLKLVLWQGEAYRNNASLRANLSRPRSCGLFGLEVGELKYTISVTLDAIGSTRVFRVEQWLGENPGFDLDYQKK